MASQVYYTNVIDLNKIININIMLKNCFFKTFDQSDAGSCPNWMYD